MHKSFVFLKIGDEKLGRFAKAVSRRKKEDPEKLKQDIEKAKKQAELDQKYQAWGKGSVFSHTSWGYCCVFTS